MLAARTIGPPPRVAKLKLVKFTVQEPSAAQVTMLVTLEKSKLDDVNGTLQMYVPPLTQASPELTGSVGSNCTTAKFCISVVSKPGPKVSELRVEPDASVMSKKYSRLVGLLGREQLLQKTESNPSVTPSTVVVAKLGVVSWTSEVGSPYSDGRLVGTLSAQPGAIQIKRLASPAKERKSFESFIMPHFFES